MASSGKSPGGHKVGRAGGPTGALTPEIFSRIRKRLQDDPQFRRRFSAQPAASLKEFGIQLAPQEARATGGRTLEQLSRSLDVDHYRRLTQGSVTPGRSRSLKTPEAPEMPEVRKIPEVPAIPKYPEALESGAIAVVLPVVEVSRLFDVVISSSGDREPISVVREFEQLVAELMGAVQIIEKVLIDRRWASQTLPCSLSRLAAADKAAAHALDLFQNLRAAGKTPRAAARSKKGRPGPKMPAPSPF